MSELSQREKALIGIMGLLIVALFGGLIFNKLSRYQSGLVQLQKGKQKQLETVLDLGKEWRHLQGIPTARVMPDALSSFIESTARRLQIIENLQLNALPSNPSGMEGVQVRIDQLNLDQLFGIIYTIETNRPVLLVEQLDISISPGSRLLRASFRVFKQSKEE